MNTTTLLAQSVQRVNPDSASAANQAGAGALDFYQAASAGDLPSATTSFGQLVGGVMSMVMVIAALLVFLYLVMGAIEWITADGDKGKIEKARNKITQSIVGIIVLAATVAIFNIVQSWLGISVLQFQAGLKSSGSGTRRTLLQRLGIGGGSSNNSSGGTGGSSTTTCPGGIAIGQTVNDGGAGGYCSESGAALVRCFGPGEGISKHDYPHYEPCSCQSGNELATFNFDSC